MIDVVCFVLQSDDGQSMEELTTLKLPAVPRKGDILITQGAEFEVRAVVWYDTWVSLKLYSLKYGYAFPMPSQTTDAP